MSNRQLNDLICAAACVCCAEEAEGKAYAGKLLVMDLDACRAGLLRCAGIGSIELLWETDAPFDGPGAFARAMARICGTSVQELADNRRKAARAYRRYLQAGREEDMIAFGEVSCSRLDEAFEQSRMAYQALFDETERRLQAGELDEIRILTIGGMAENFLAEYCVRERFSSDPLLPDPLFWELDDGESRAQLAEKGRKILAARQAEKPRRFGRNIAVCLLDRNGQEEEIALADADQTEAELAEPRFTQPFLYLKGEPIRLRIDGEIRKTAAPEMLLSLDTDADMISAALVFRDGSARILLRNEMNRAQMVEMKLP